MRYPSVCRKVIQAQHRATAVVADTRIGVTALSKYASGIYRDTQTLSATTANSRAPKRISLV